MERLPTDKLILELIERPAFCVKDDHIIYANEAARQIQIHPGMSILDLLSGDLGPYFNDSSSSLSLTLQIARSKCVATVTRTEDYDVFRIDQTPTVPELRMFNLAAQQMRLPLTSALTVCDEILSVKKNREDLKIAHMSRALYQLHRIICNIADTGRYMESGFDEKKPVNITAVFEEIMEKACATLQTTNIHILYFGPGEDIFTMANTEKLTRAVYNMLSNAVKYTPDGGSIEVKLTRHDNMLHFSVLDNGEGISNNVIANMYTRYLRYPGAEDGRNGVGLGMPLIQAAASAHNGAVLIDRPEEHGTRVTLTLQIIPVDHDTLHSPIQTLCDYAGGRDIALLELADVLPASAYMNLL